MKRFVVALLLVIPLVAFAEEKQKAEPVKPTMEAITAEAANALFQDRNRCEMERAEARAMVRVLQKRVEELTPKETPKPKESSGR